MSRSISFIALFPFVAVFLFNLSACSAIPWFSEKNIEEVTGQPLNTLPDNWTITGRISLNNEQENWYAKFIWKQNKQDYQLSFTGPLGATELQISQLGQDVSIKTPSIQRSGHDLEQLVYQETGLNLPISSLRYWVQGYPDPSLPARVNYTMQKQISSINQAQWHIQYPKRISVQQPSGKSLFLPRKLVATGQDSKIKLIITRW